MENVERKGKRMTRAEIALENAVIAQDEARAALASIKRVDAAYLFSSGADYFRSVRKVAAAYRAAEERVRLAEAAL